MCPDYDILFIIKVKTAKACIYMQYFIVIMTLRFLENTEIFRDRNRKHIVLVVVKTYSVKSQAKHLLLIS